jgi:hypothetical protein
LRTVGGANASFFGTSTLQSAIEHILSDVVARKSVVKLNVSVAQGGTNSHGYATLSYEDAGVRRRTFYVRKEAVSLLQPGAERDFDPDRLYSPASRDMTFGRVFFDRIVLEIEENKSIEDHPHRTAPNTTPKNRKSSAIRNSARVPVHDFLTIGVDNQVTSPKRETVVNFDRYQFVLMPKTHDHVQSIHLDLATQKLGDEEALTIINRFLSVMTWCDDQFAIAQDGWSGNPVPVPVPKRNLAFAAAQAWIFDRLIPSSKEARMALALYREARNAQQNFMVSYAVLNFFKVIEVRYGKKGAAKNWFRDNFETLKKDPEHNVSFSRFAGICGNKPSHEYIYEACRCAVAHARSRSTSDPDDANELTRLHNVADVLRVLARHFITTELGISDVIYSGD